jgi:hypothetical protein
MSDVADMRYGVDADMPRGAAEMEADEAAALARLQALFWAFFKVQARQIVEDDRAREASE